MSTLKVNGIQDTSGSNPSTTSQIFEGRARAWVNYDQRTLQDTRNKYGVTDVTDLGTGYGRVNFTNTLSNPCAVGSASYDANISNAYFSDILSVFVTNTYAEYSTRNAANAYFDCEYIMIAVFCDTNN
tara:strand:+ start:955 stop:1338 length:384 start_codon:yes stop_codon:yes gene_type:complete